MITLDFNGDGIIVTSEDTTVADSFWDSLNDDEKTNLTEQVAVACGYDLNEDGEWSNAQ